MALEFFFARLGRCSVKASLLGQISRHTIAELELEKRVFKRLKYTMGLTCIRLHKSLELDIAT